jgi:hypothetical protein
MFEYLDNQIDYYKTSIIYLKFNEYHRKKIDYYEFYQWNKGYLAMIKYLYN